MPHTTENRFQLRFALANGLKPISHSHFGCHFRSQIDCMPTQSTLACLHRVRRALVERKNLRMLRLDHRHVTNCKQFRTLRFWSKLQLILAHRIISRNRELLFLYRRHMPIHHPIKFDKYIFNSLFALVYPQTDTHMF